MNFHRAWFKMELMKNIQEEEADYLLKKSDLFEAYCSCGKTIYSFVDRGEYRVVCKSCGKNIFHVFCEKCGSGFAYPENAKEINVAAYTWQCPDCKQDLPLPHQETGGYYREELPESVLKEEKSRGLPGWGKILIFVILGFIYWLFEIKLK